jgi:hypothetical protein
MDNMMCPASLERGSIFTCVFHERLSAFKVLRGVNRDTGVVDFDHVYCEAVLEKSEHLDSLRAFHGAGRRCCEGMKTGWRESVKAKLSTICRPGRVVWIGYWLARECQCTAIGA